MFLEKIESAKTIEQTTKIAYHEYIRYLLIIGIIKKV